jgi:hypothetical protein
MGKNLFEVCQNLEGISVASYFHVYENEDAVSHYVLNEFEAGPVGVAPWTSHSPQSRKTWVRIHTGYTVFTVNKKCCCDKLTENALRVFL